MFLSGKYRHLSPSFRFVHFSLTKKIVGLGGQFFIIMISMLFVFQLINIVISRIAGPIAVTQYNIAYKYFNVLVMAVNIVFTPFWSAFTDAYVKQDYTWMRNARSKLEIMGLLCIPVAVLMVLLSNFLYTYWIGSKVDIPISLSIALAIFAIAQTFGGIYVTLLNGTGKVRIQMLALRRRRSDVLRRGFRYIYLFCCSPAAWGSMLRTVFPYINYWCYRCGYVLRHSSSR